MGEEANEGWDWPLLLYMATVVLFMTRKDFWETTPRVLFSLLDAHAQINSVDKGKKSNTKSRKISNNITPVDHIPFL